MKIYIYALTIFFFTSCYSQQHKTNCYNSQLDSLKNTVLYNNVKTRALDSLNSWINVGIMASGIPPLRDRLEWKIDDAIFFNKKRTRVIVMILERDTSINSKADYIAFYFGIQINQNWQFYFKSLPLLYMPRKLNYENTTQSFEELSSRGIEQVLKEYFKPGTCTINENFFDYDIENLQEKHESFLNEK